MIIRIQVNGRSLEKDMAGWAEYVTNSAMGLTHLCIIAASGRRWAQTANGRFVRVREARKINQLLMSRDIQINQVTAAGRDYTVDWKYFSGTVIRAWRLFGPPHLRQKEILLASSKNNYIVIGLAEDNNEDDLKQAIEHAINHLSQHNFGDEPVKDDIYGAAPNLMQEVL